MPLLWLLLAVAPVAAQTLDDVRDQLSRDLADAGFVRSLTGLVLLSDEVELATARYRFDNVSNTEVFALALPFSRTFDVFGEGAPGLYVEGVVGYAEADESVADVYAGGLPGLETRVDTTWRTFGGLAGAGLAFDLGKGVELTPLVDVGLTRLENEANYSGPGAGLTRALLDGIAFNWDALVLGYGGGVRAAWDRRLGDRHALEVVARYDLRWSESIEEDDRAQDFRSRAQLATLRGDVVGPTGLDLWERPLEWRVSAGYRRFLESDLFGAEEFVQIGGGLELDAPEGLGIGGRFALSGAAIFGDGMTGWTVGLSVSF